MERQRKNKELKTLQGPNVGAAAGLPYRYALAVRRRNCPAHFLLRVLQHGNGLAVQIHLQESLHAGRIGSTHPQVATVRSPIDGGDPHPSVDRKSTRLNSSHQIISYAVFCLKKKTLIESNQCS